jgi:gliding motility-associated-like protein
VVTVAQINTISPAITGAIVANQTAYQAYIDANPGLFSSPATAAEVQAMVNAVNASQTVLVQIGNEGDSPNTVPSVVTVAQINTISPAIVGAIVANEAAYRAYIDANPGLFSSPATAAEVQAMITAVNAAVVPAIVAPVFEVLQSANGLLSVSGTAEKNSSVLITFPDGSTTTVVASATGTFGPVISALPQVNKGFVTAIATTSAGLSSVLVTVNYDNPITIQVAEAFTPDGDGINDTWVIYELDKYPNSTVRVYNRWGHLVFSAKDYQNDWDGHFRNNSNALPESGSYYYQIDFGTNGTIDKEGWLYIRK